jgi:transcriptional regulator NrdR family protein
MKCPHCGHTGKKLIPESRPHGDSVYRRRYCRACLQGFVTVETAPPGLRMPKGVQSSYARRGETRTQGVGEIDAPRSENNAAHLQSIWK